MKQFIKGDRYIMLKISQELKNIVVGINQKIKEKYQNSLIYDKDKLVIAIDNINKIRRINTMNKYVVAKKFGKRGIVGVDGSINTIGSSFPHYISIMQAKAKSTVCYSEDEVMVDIHTPLLNECQPKNIRQGLSAKEDERLLSDKMALLELKVAERALETLDPSVILMDGSLTRYYNCSRGIWERFISKAIEMQVHVIGVIEEIKTCEISKQLEGEKGLNIEGMYDREVLFGVMERGQLFVLNGWEVGGINKCFMRTSNDPHVIAVDFIKEDLGNLDDLAAIIMALTPQDGRGIPIWLDIVDAEVKISDKLAEALVETYIDSDIRQKLLIPKRDKRTL